MYGFGSGRLTKFLCKCLILDKNFFSKVSDMYFNAFNKSDKLRKHFINIFLTDRHVFPLIILTWLTPAHAFYIYLQCAVKADDITIHLNIIKYFKFLRFLHCLVPISWRQSYLFYPANYIIIVFSIFVTAELLYLQNKYQNPVPIFILFDIFHLIVSFPIYILMYSRSLKPKETPSIHHIYFLSLSSQ